MGEKRKRAKALVHGVALSCEVGDPEDHHITLNVSKSAREDVCPAPSCHGADPRDRVVSLTVRNFEEKGAENCIGKVEKMYTVPFQFSLIFFFIAVGTRHLS